MSTYSGYKRFYRNLGSVVILKGASDPKSEKGRDRNIFQKSNNK